MDLGIHKKRALVCASSKGLGRACALALAAEGANVCLVARGADALRDTAEEISRRHPGVDITTVVADIATEEGRTRVLEAFPDPAILVNNAGGPPGGDFREWSRDDWIAALDANMLAPIAMIRATVDGMIDRRFGRIINITSGAVKAPIATLGLSNGARAGLTGFVAGLARSTVGKGVTINNLLPGPFSTDRLQATAEAAARAEGVTSHEILTRRMEANPAGRFGDPDEFGAFCAFLCSKHAGYMTGQNILLDGGAYPGTL